MMHALLNLLTGREYLWKVKFRSFYDFLKQQADLTIHRIKEDSLSPLLRDMSQHTETVAIGLRVALAYRGLITVSPDVMKNLVLGKHEKPFINVHLRNLPDTEASNAIVIQLAGFVFLSTVNSAYTQIRSLLLMQLKHQSGKQAVIEEAVSALSSCPASVGLEMFSCFYRLIRRRLCPDNYLDDPVALAGLPNWLGEHALLFKRVILDHFLNLTNEDLKRFLTSGSQLATLIVPKLNRSLDA